MTYFVGKNWLPKSECE